MENVRHPEPGPRNPEGEVHALLLAAGSASRFGGDKLLAPLRGRPLIGHVAAAVAQAIAAGYLAGGVAVVPSGAATLARPLGAAGLDLVGNPDAAGGISSSLRRGLERLAAGPAGAALVVLADQPGLRLEVIAGLVGAWRRLHHSVRPRYHDQPGEPGHPVLLDRSLWPLSAGLSGDAGFRDLLRGAPLTLVDVAGANPDVDTPEDLFRLERGP